MQEGANPVPAVHERGHMNKAGSRCNKTIVRNILCAALCAALYAGMPVSHAQSTASGESLHQYDIPAGPLSGALGAWGAQSDRQVVFAPDLVAGKQTRGASGRYGAEQALTQVLAGTGLAWKRVDGQTYALEREATARPREPRHERAPDPGPPPMAEHEITHLGSITVTGTRLTSAESEQAQAKIVINRQTIDASGVNTVSELLNTLPAFSLQSTTSPLQGGRGASFSYLRGLPKDFTLTLINGRRVGYGADADRGAFNLSLLPLAAVERVEVLPAGSAAIYGGSALAGIVNVILRDRLDGGQIDLNHGSASNYEESGASIAWGKSWSRGSLLVGATYRGNTALQVSDRRITSNLDYSRFGGHRVLFPYTSPGNVFSLSGGPLPGLTSTFAGVPAGQDGTHLTIDDFKSMDGVRNTSSQFFEAVALLPKSEQYTGVLDATLRANDRIDIFTEWFYSHTTGEEVDYPKFAIGTVVVPANNPYNPFGVPVGIDYLFSGTTSCYCATADYTRGLVGARGDFGDTSWSWEVAASKTLNRERLMQVGIIDNTKINMALANIDPASTLNLFGDRRWTDRELAPYVTETGYRFRTTLEYLNGFIRGRLFDLGAGPWEAVLGVEYERNAMDYAASVFFHGTYDNKAAFAELSAPLVASRSGNSGAGAMLAMTGALRYDNYNSFGSRVSPEIGVQFRPVPALLLRANRSAAYKPPTLYQLNYPMTSQQKPLTDPRRGGEAYTATTYLGGNPDLDALTGNAQTYGLVYSPGNAYGLELSVTGFRIHTDNFPQQINYLTLINMENLFPGAVVRAEPTATDKANGYAGVITTIFDTFQNFGTFDVAGVDLGLSWKVATDRHGSFRPSFAATYMQEYKYQLAPGTKPIETTSQANLTGWAPRWKANVSLGWQDGPVQATVVGRWVGTYSDYDDFNPATPVRKLGNFWMFDANLRYNLGRTLVSNSPWLSQAYVAIGGVNIFNRLPSYSYYQGNLGYDPTQYDIRGRYIYAQIGTRF